MQVLVAGGGPVGTYTAIALARHGHVVTVVDRDPGPGADGEWQRKGVMQGTHPHGWRPGVRRALLAEMPDVYQEILAAGAREQRPPGVPDAMAAMATGYFCRRPVVERVLRAAAQRQPGLTWLTGHVDDVVVEDGVARGLVVDGDRLDADAVVVATGRVSHLGERLRGRVEGGPCGSAYIFRQYRAREAEWACDLTVPSFSTGPGYVSLVMPQDDATHSVLVAYPVDAPEFAALRTADGFALMTQAIPNLAPWTDPERYEPVTEVTVGGNLTNTYQLQGPALGMPPARGLYFVGDAILTTNPAAGRNLSLLLGHVQHLLATLDTVDDPDSVSLALDEWAEQHVRPWFEDHVRWDRTLLRRFAGQDLDLDERIPSDVICAAVEVDRSILPNVMMYLGMAAGPDVLDPVEDTVRTLLRDGWRPRTDGPTSAQLAALVSAVPA
ncbi:MAG: FAD-dependent oxidoreductase [Frankiales bacterium]|nr:FAD-dependent oxidoreductase [Frankiales bacterium]